MRNYLFSLLGVILLIGFSSCHTNLPVGTQNVVESGGVRMQLNWIKDKGDKFDASITLINLSDDYRGFRTSSFQCERGRVRGQAVTKYSKNGIKIVALDPGERQELIMFCRFGGPQKGSIELGVAEVHSISSDYGRLVKKLSNGMTIKAN